MPFFVPSVCWVVLRWHLIWFAFQCCCGPLFCEARIGNRPSRVRRVLRNSALLFVRSPSCVRPSFLFHVILWVSSLFPIPTPRASRYLLVSPSRVRLQLRGLLFAQQFAVFQVSAARGAAARPVRPPLWYWSLLTSLTAYCLSVYHCYYPSGIAFSFFLLILSFSSGCMPVCWHPTHTYNRSLSLSLSP